MTLRGGIDLVAELRNKGYSGQRLRTAVERVFPNGLSQSVSALIRRGTEVRSVTNAANRQRGEGPLPTPAFVTNEFLRDKYRYFYKLPYSVDGVAQRPLGLNIDSDTPLSLAEINRDAANVANLLRLNELDDYPVDERADVTFGQIQIVRVERGR